ncbi:hypothetical protein L1887_05388 [Cichorium endivia]|nr:hypothetical protein L1887_05388 [Cichorium endivia]
MLIGGNYGLVNNTTMSEPNQDYYIEAIRGLGFGGALMNSLGQVKTWYAALTFEINTFQGLFVALIRTTTINHVFAVLKMLTGKNSIIVTKHEQKEDNLHRQGMVLDLA